MKKFIVALSFTLQGIIAIAQDAPKGIDAKSTAPVFEAKDQNGKTVSSKALLKKGPVVVVFYRGQWCPYCNKQLKQLEDSIKLITAKGATVIAITPEKPENVLKTIKKTKATFPILYDDALKIAKGFNVNFAVDEKTIEKYKGYGIDFEKANGTNGANLPVPAVYIIGKNGKITYKYFDSNYSKRVSVAEIVSNL